MQAGVAEQGQARAASLMTGLARLMQREFLISTQQQLLLLVAQTCISKMLGCMQCILLTTCHATVHHELAMEGVLHVTPTHMVCYLPGAQTLWGCTPGRWAG